jgi:hypothetical protein
MLGIVSLIPYMGNDTPKPSPVDAVGFLSKITTSLLVVTGDISECRVGVLP